MAARTSANFSSCFTFLKEALVLPTQNPKLFTPVFLLIALPSFLVLSTNVLFVQPLSMDMAELAIKLQTTDPLLAPGAPPQGDEGESQGSSHNHRHGHRTPGHIHGAPRWATRSAAGSGRSGRRGG
ncbi:Os09g0129500 [Oryza sativa Japonica Group]|uniref:Os09g0129500 protein n=1 Tax=Oryza sativa subsp. japonica TaxID=39947 RepID=A0A0P0XJZ9_ORYSJ|nr:hypothetical protein EE612_046147 [Oryza sativa]BAT06932.1 Os09g0129500 [Oryza sativa Japonica Group]